MKDAPHNGFTVIELLIGIVAAAILAGVAGVLLVNSYQGWVRGGAAAGLERDATLVIHTLELAVRGASNAVPGEVGSDKLQVRYPDGVIRSFIVQSSGGRKSLVYDNGSNTMVLASNTVAVFSSAVTNRLVRVSLTLTNEDIGLGMACSNIWIRMRNHP